MLKKLDILVLIFAPLLAAWISLATHANFLTSIFLFFTLPSVWFSLRTQAKVKKTLSFAAVISVPMALIIDYFATGDQSWHVTTIFAFRVLGTIPLEDFFMGFFAAYYAVIFYEHFLDKGKHNLSDKRLKYLLWPLILISILIITASLLTTSALVIPHAYLWLGIILGVIPSLSIIIKYPKLLSKYLKTGAYFFYYT